MPPFVAVDLDDTLYPERDYVLSGFRAVSKHLAERTEVAENDVYRRLESDFEAGVRGNAFDRVVQAFDLKVEVDRLVEVYRTHEPSLSLYPDAEVFLQECNQRMTVITDGREVKQRQKLGALGIERSVESVYISGEHGEDFWKPSPKLFRRALTEFNARPQEACYVGDNPAKDFLGPNELGMHTVHVSRDQGEYSGETPPSPKGEPDRTVDSLRELLTLVPWLLRDTT